jgi:hypothetical protein
LIRQLSKVQSSLEKVIAEKVVSSFLEWELNNWIEAS